MTGPNCTGTPSATGGRPWRGSLGKLLRAGWVPAQPVEPRATEEARAVDSRRHEETHRTPTFLAVRLRRP
ncbi:hypothetical protein ACIRPU_07900 [Streptomyces sp. NPDC102259]|uniref:hypothetical protein n=1 Tax=Streptomyces sp. NPDC102259 TaxID=3366148 RepID=UPI0038103D96